MILFLGFINVAKFDAANLTVSDLTIQTNKNTYEKNETFLINLSDTNPADTESFIKLPSGLDYEGVDSGNGSVTQDKVKHQLTIAWTDPKSKKISLRLKSATDATYTLTASSIRDDKEVTSRNVSINISSGVSSASPKKQVESQQVPAATSKEPMKEAQSKPSDSSKDEKTPQNKADSVNQKTAQNKGTLPKKSADDLFQSRAAATNPIRQGTLETCYWYLDSDYTLHIEAGTISDKVLAVDPVEGTSSAISPWSSRYSPVRKIIIEGPVVLQGDVSGLFGSLTELTEIKNLDLINTSAVTSMGGMFSNDTSLVTLDLSTWDTSNVTRMRSMFYNNSSLQTVKFGDWNLKKVKTFDFMFYDNKSLTDLDLSKWKMQKGFSAIQMLYGANNLSRLSLGPETTFGGWSSVGLVVPPTELPYFGKWRRENTEEKSVTSSQLSSKYDGATMAGTYVWAKSLRTIKAKDTLIGIGESWDPRTNFISATDDDNLPIPFAPSMVTGSVNTQNLGPQKILFKNGLAEQTATVTVLKRELAFHAIPDTFAFQSLKISGQLTESRQADPDWKLVVKDTRKGGAKWQVKAQLAIPLSDQKGRPLDSKLIFRQKGQSDQNVTSQDDVIVFAKKSKDIEGLYDVSWSKDEGFYIQTPPGAAKAEQYQGAIRWILEDAPA